MAFPSGGYTTYQNAIDDNLINYLRFNETSGVNIYDAVGSGATSLDCSVSNDVDDSTIIDGKFSKCRDFSAQSNATEVVVSGGDTTNYNIFTISVWIKVTNFTSGITVFRLGNADFLLLQVDSGGAVDVNHDANFINGTINVNDAAWHHVCIHHTGSSTEFFVDNVSGGSISATSNLYPYELIQFCYNDTTAGIAVDDLAIWDRNLSASDRGNIYNSGTGQAIIPFDFYIETVTEPLSTGEGNTDSDPVQITRTIQESLDMGESAIDPPYAKLLVDNVIASLSTPTNVIQNILASEDIQVDDLLGLAFILSLLDAVNTSDTTTLIKKLLDTIIETINPSETLSSNLYADEIIQEASDLADNLLRFFELLATEQLNVGHTLTVEPTLYNSLTDTLDQSDTITTNYGFNTIVEDSFTIDDSISTNGILGRVLEEGLLFLEIKTVPGEGSYSGWVMNPETFSVWNYEDFNFNSITKFNNIVLGASDSGVYSLEGTTDDGTYIESKLVTAALDFGSRHIKQVPLSYMGLTSDGKIVLKVRVDNKADVWYEITPVEDYEHTRKIPIGKGLIGRNWQFEIVTVDNSSLDVENIEFYPVIFKRKL